MVELTDKVALVTGATRGIGLGWATHLLKRGNIVIATARDPEHGASNLIKLSAEVPDGKLIVVQLDTTDPASIEAMAKGIKEEHGIQHIDILVNNAGGVFEPMDAKSMADVTAEHLTKTFALNSTGPYIVTQQLFSQGLIGGDRPTLAVFISSGLGSTTSALSHPYMGAAGKMMYAYRASKAALNMLVACISVELGPKNITAVAMCPGYVQTDATGHDPAAMPVDVSVASCLKVLESDRELNGKYLQHNGDELGW